ncbi:MAG: ATP-dependent sacrificial sulfur transferase LarE [Thermodesulfobacteriota bacterium]|nr:ATP-dependent sacrificial sulfur transferase LarE [Thermodesulfobacteriota bacterium]
MKEKLQKVKQILANMESVLIAFSGGVDSAFLLKVARDVLGNRVLAVTAKSLIHPLEEIKQAKGIALDLGVKHKIIETQELSNPRFFNNSKDRCYWCKRELYGELIGIAGDNNLNYVLDGTNFDDLNDFRPGIKAARELGTRSPLIEAKFTKEDIRTLSKGMGLEVWGKPSLACLASRFPYGMKITREDVAKIDNAERFLRGLGITQARVRHHDGIVRIEVMDEDISKLLGEKLRGQILSHFKGLGYLYVTIDLEGYRTGSMNEVLQRDEITSSP